MTTATDEAVEPAATTDHEAVEHAHPSDRQYVIIALILGVITAAEVGTYFIEDASTTALVAMLFPMMVAKFAIVTGYFMHLKYDNPLFKRIFVFGLALAIVVYCATLVSMEFFSDDYFRYIS
ncbi:MAG: cytochrome C oxidase subunit IV family protein [Acidimicrobiia bacterium]